MGKMKMQFGKEPFDVGDVVCFGAQQGIVVDGERSDEYSTYTICERPERWGPLMFWSTKSGRYAFFVSIRKASRCLYSRRVGKSGKRILGYSICLRLFNKDIL